MIQWFFSFFRCKHLWMCEQHPIKFGVLNCRCIYCGKKETSYFEF
jgi:hypothetical protein